MKLRPQCLTSHQLPFFKSSMRTKKCERGELRRIGRGAESKSLKSMVRLGGRVTSDLFQLPQQIHPVICLSKVPSASGLDVFSVMTKPQPKLYFHGFGFNVFFFGVLIEYISPQFLF